MLNFTGTVWHTSTDTAGCTAKVLEYSGTVWIIGTGTASAQAVYWAAQVQCDIQALVQYLYSKKTGVYRYGVVPGTGTAGVQPGMLDCTGRVWCADIVTTVVQPGCNLYRYNVVYTHWYTGVQSGWWTVCTGTVWRIRAVPQCTGKMLNYFKVQVGLPLLIQQVCSQV
jgi:hypothetical protein